MRLLCLLCLLCCIGCVGCAPVVAEVTRVDADLPDGPGPPEPTEEVVWSGTWLATALDRVLLQGQDTEDCLQLVLVSPSAWDPDLPVDATPPWALEGAMYVAGGCDAGLFVAGEPLDGEQIAGTIEVDAGSPPAWVTLDLTAEVGEATWEIATTVELGP